MNRLLIPFSTAATVILFTQLALGMNIKRFPINSDHGGTSFIVTTENRTARFFFTTTNQSKASELVAEKLKLKLTPTEMRQALETVRNVTIALFEGEQLVEVTSLLPPVFNRVGSTAEKRPNKPFTDNSLGVALAVHSGDRGGYATNHDLERMTLRDEWRSDFEKRVARADLSELRFNLNRNYLLEKYGTDEVGRELYRAVERLDRPGLFDILYFEKLNHAAVYLFDDIVFQLSKLQYGEFDVVRYEDIFSDWNRAVRVVNAAPRFIDTPSYHYQGANTDQQLSALHGQSELAVPSIKDPHAVRLIQRDKKRMHLPVQIPSECAEIITEAMLFAN